MYPEVFPAIAVTADCHELWEHVEVDVQRVTEVLQDGGLSDEQIPDTTIVIDAAHKTSEKGLIMGRYQKSQQQVLLFTGSEAARRYESDAQGTSSRPDRVISRGLTKSLRHELEHRVVHATGSRPEWRARERQTRNRFLGMTLLGVSGASAEFYGLSCLPEIPHAPPYAQLAGNLAITAATAYKSLSYFTGRLMARRYRTDPEEAWCVAAETEYLHELVSVARRTAEVEVAA